MKKQAGAGRRRTKIGKRIRRNVDPPVGRRNPPEKTPPSSVAPRPDKPAEHPKARTGERIIGFFSAHERGFGFVLRGESEPDLFIPASGVGDALHGDRVEAVVVEGRRGRERRRWGRVINIIERSGRPLVGRFTGEQIIPRDQRFWAWPQVHPADRGGARPGQMVFAEISHWPLGRLPARARVIEVLGEENDPELESRLVLRSFGFAESFPPEAVAEADGMPRRVRKEDLAGRKDLRPLLTLTIDPESARDFDDALAIERRGDGYRVWVSIADVSHYVTPGSALDEEAYARATSVYFPDRAIPMLPEPLSTGICSLKAGEDRLTMSVEMVFDGQGRRMSFEVYPAVIRSRFRLTYDQVEEMAEEGRREKISSELWPTLSLLRGLAEKRRARRWRRGAIDLDVPEAEVVFDERGEVETILRRTQTWSHQLVEEFMLAANEAVAELLTARQKPLLYRVHEPPRPSAVLALADFLAPLGFRILSDHAEPEHIRPRDYQKVIRAARGSPYEMMVKVMCLRSMMQAEYLAENRGHFGLASKCYCHFTSPIRRYPDLVVHRSLKQLLGLEQSQGDLAPRNLAEAAEHSSERERAAEEAERKMVDLYRARWMARRVGEEFEGVVSGITAFGIFVELAEVFVEGLVPLEEMDEEMDFREEEMVLRGRKTKREFRIGDHVRVCAVSVDVDRRRINFRLLSLS